MALGRQSTDAVPETQYFQVYGALIQQAPFASRYEFPGERRLTFTVRNDGLSLLDLLRGWQRLTADHHPLLETYGASIVLPDEHPRARFLLLIQALEGLYGHETRADYEARKKRNQAARERVLAVAEACASFDPVDKKFLKKHLGAEPRGGLDTALRKLFEGLPTDVTPMLEKTALIGRMLTAPEKAQGAADALRIVRNDLAHGNRGYGATELDEVARIIDRVARAHLLRVLGYDVEVQARSLDVT